MSPHPGADFLMGVYLIILAVKDLEYRNSYNIYAYEWGTSFLCSAIGVLAMISSEVSHFQLKIVET
jgi:leucine-rich repeat-containing G protein-coupled receptor 8